MSLVPGAPEPRFVVATDSVRIATYDVGDEGAPAVLAVHGFASSAQLNWFPTGWVRDLGRAGFRVVAIDQRGHDPATPPRQPVLSATGSEDGILPKSRRLAAATPNGKFFEIPGRNHFNAPTARTFRDRALAFLTVGSPVRAT